MKKLFKPYLGLKREIYIIFISKTINAMGALIGPFMTLLLSKKIGLSSAETGFYVAVLGFLFVPSSLIGGKLSDTYGRKRVLIIFELIAAVGYVACIFIQPSMNLVYVLMATTFCFGVAGPSHDAMTADLTTPEQRQGAFSLNYLGFNFGFAISQIFAGFLFENHFVWMFIIDGITALIGILLIAVFVKETSTNTKHSESKDIKIKELKQSAKSSTIAVLFSKPILMYFALATIGYRFVYSQWSFMIPLHAEANFVNEGAKLYGLLGTFNATIVVICTPLITLAFGKFTHIRRIFYSGLLFTVGFGMLGFVSTKTAFFTSVFIFTLGEILEAISSVPFIMSHAPASHRARISSILSLLIGTGYTMGSLVMGSVLEIASFEVCWKISATVVLIAAILMKLLEKYDNKNTCRIEIGNYVDTKNVLSQ
ncbi:MAG: MFS transporter [Firmicutes bacterium HGW-Firmicutes-1]|jgi:MFS family permease|nr:MAG: MFS transporter [Firmicutes bacterium HGW-Firmicutes-1]